MMHNAIKYEIIDGCCSYCGKEAAVIELPDGDVEISDRCDYCDEYNLEEWLEQLASD